MLWIHTFITFGLVHASGALQKQVGRPVPIARFTCAWELLRKRTTIAQAKGSSR